jgi:hypothetical protein
MTTTAAPSNLIVKFDTLTDTSSFSPPSAGPLDAGATGISFTLQIIARADPLISGGLQSTVIGSDPGQINNVTSQDLANVIAQYFSDKSILVPSTDGAGGSGRNIRSMKLIVNVVDPGA